MLVKGGPGDVSSDIYHKPQTARNMIKIVEYLSRVFDKKCRQFSKLSYIIVALLVFISSWTEYFTLYEIGGKTPDLETTMPKVLDMKSINDFGQMGKTHRADWLHSSMI